MPPKRATKKAAAAAEGIFDGLVFAISGTLTKTRDEFVKLLEANGGTIASSVTKKVTHLISDDSDSGNAKVSKAKEYGVFIVGEAFVEDSVSKGKKLDESSYDLNKSSSSSSTSTTTSVTTASKSKKRKAEDAEAEEDEEPTTKTKKTTRDKATKKAKSAKDDDDDEEADKAASPKKADSPKKDEEVKKTKVIVKGRAAVDALSGLTADAHVLEVGSVVYDAMLNQTNISAGNNNNKYYVIQVLEADSGGRYWVWNRWGRVGENGQHKIVPLSSKDAAIADFMKKFKDKTKNTWVDNNTSRYTHHPGKYHVIEIDYGADEEPKKVVKKDDKGKGKGRESVESKLDARVQDLVKLIFDLKMMESTMKAMEFDVEKSPLGKLTKRQIKEGYEVLKDIEAVLDSKSKGDLAELSSLFYSKIPHNFGRQKLPIISNREKLMEKMKMLEALADIEIATTLLKQSENDTCNPVDAHYAALKCNIEPLDKSSAEYKQIAKYVQNTHQGKVPVIKNLYRIEREGETDRFKKSAHLGNRKLLWHGSRLTNFVGIISQGLRIAPPEAPASGYRFGKGIYFADIMSLSSIYCRTGDSNDFCMLLGDVALGKTADLQHDQYMEKPLAGSHSTKALGSIEPNPKEDYQHPSGCVIPNGPIVNSGHTGVSCREHQYIVYDVSQANLNYLLHLNWK